MKMGVSFFILYISFPFLTISFFPVPLSSFSFISSVHSLYFLFQLFFSPVCISFNVVIITVILKNNHPKYLFDCLRKLCDQNTVEWI